jgi:transposase InsO family protein
MAATSHAKAALARQPDINRSFHATKQEYGDASINQQWRSSFRRRK